MHLKLRNVYWIENFRQTATTRLLENSNGEANIFGPVFVVGDFTTIELSTAIERVSRERTKRELVKDKGSKTRSKTQRLKINKFEKIWSNPIVFILIVHLWAGSTVPPLLDCCLHGTYTPPSLPRLNFFLVRFCVCSCSCECHFSIPGGL